jgi:hypothetical protein
MKQPVDKTHPPRTGWGRTAWYGAEAGIALTFLYGLLFVGYVVVRSTVNLLAIPVGDGGLAGILLGTWVSLALSSLVFAAIASIPAAAIGALTALALRAILGRVDDAHAPWRAITIGAGVCLAASLIPLALVLQSLGMQWTPAIAETLTFWLILPIALYAIAGGLAGWQVHRKLAA